MSKQFFVTEKQLDEFKKIYDDIYGIVYGVPEPLREFIYAIEDIRNQPDSATEELAKLREQTRCVAIRWEEINYGCSDKSAKTLGTL